MATSEREIHSEAVDIKKQQPTNSAKVAAARSGKRLDIQRHFPLVLFIDI
ncbi:hypothetical protein [Sphingomonas sp.]